MSICLLNSKWISVGVLLLCSALGVICFGKSLHYPFLDWDDQTYILKDPAIQQLSIPHLAEIWLSPYKAVWYPLARTSHAIDIFLFDHNAFYHRLVSLFIHIINGLLVYLLARKIIALRYTVQNDFQAIAAATAAALAFIAHPQHVEVVAWVTQRNELLATAFFLLTLIQYCVYLSNQKKQYYFFALFFAAIAMTAKPTAVGIPVILLVLDRLFNHKNTLVVTLLEKIPFILVAAGICFISIATHENSYAMRLHELYGFNQRLCYAAYNILDFIYRFFVPINLTPVVEFPYWIETISARSWLPLICILLIVTLCSVRLYRKTEMIPLVVIAYLVLIFPSSGVLMFGNYSPGNRYMYLPSALLLTFISVAAYKLFTIRAELTRFYYYALVFVLITLLSLVSRMQVTYWNNDISLWKYAITQQPKSAAALTYLGVVLTANNVITPREGAEIIEKSVSIQPLYIGLNNLLVLYTALNDQEMLLHTHKRLARYYPNSTPASLASLGIYELGINNFAKAQKMIVHGIRIDPTLCEQIEQQLMLNEKKLPEKSYVDLVKIVQQAKTENLCN